MGSSRRRQLSLVSSLVLLSLLIVLVTTALVVHLSLPLSVLLAILIALLGSLFVAEYSERQLRIMSRRARALAVGAPVAREPLRLSGGAADLAVAFDCIEEHLRLRNGVAELMVNTHDQRRVFEAITASIHSMVGGVDVEIVLLDETGRLELVAAEGSFVAAAGSTFALTDVPLVDEVFASGEPVRTDARTADRLGELGGGHPVDFALAVPLRVGPEVLGAVLVLRHEGTPLTDVEAKTVRSFAAQASVAVRNAALLENERAAHHEAETLRNISEHLVQRSPIDDALQAVARESGDLFGFEHTGAVLEDPVSYGLPLSGLAADIHLTDVWEAVGIDRHDALYLPGGHLVLRDHAVLSGAEGVMLIPLSRDHVLCGALMLWTNRPHREPEEAALRVAGTIGREASLAVQNAYLYEQVRRRVENLETIFRISQAVASSLQDRIVLNRVMDVVSKMLPADTVILMAEEEGRERLGVSMTRGVIGQQLSNLVVRTGEDVPGRVFVTHESERYDDITTSDTAFLTLAAAEGLSSLVAVPLLARGQSVGVILVLARPTAAFTSSEVDLLRTFASQAALAIDTARRFSREHHAASVLRESILPSRLPSIEGVRASSIYLPSGTESEIGGDYYDLFTTPEGRIIITIGDVCGKGITAATKTSMLKHTIRGMATAGLKPASILRELNTMIVDAHDPSGIVTLWVGELDRSTGELLFANGGHPPGMLLHQEDRRVVELAPTGPLIGAVATAQWLEELVVIQPGDTLLLYTDGVTEARNGNGFFSEARVKRVLRAGGDPSSVTQHLLDAITTYACGRLRDDAAILAITYDPRHFRDTTASRAYPVGGGAGEDDAKDRSIRA